MTEYRWHHFQKREPIASGSLKAKSHHEAKHFAIMDSGIDKLDEWLFCTWIETPNGSVMFRNVGSDNWQHRMAMGSECLVVYEDTPQNDRYMLMPITYNRNQSNESEQLVLDFG